MHLIGVAYSHPLGRGRSAVPPIDNLTDMRYVGSVTVNEANGRFYEPSPGTELYGGGKRELYHLEVYQDALPSSSFEAKCAGRLNQRHLQSVNANLSVYFSLLRTFWQPFRTLSPPQLFVRPTIQKYSPAS